MSNRVVGVRLGLGFVGMWSDMRQFGSCRQTCCNLGHFARHEVFGVHGANYGNP